MAEKHRLLAENSDELSNGIRPEYGSLDAYYERLRSEERDCRQHPRKFVYRKRDCVVISVLGFLVAASVVVTLAIGLPKILQKTAADVGQLSHSHSFTPITNVVKTNLAVLPPDPSSMTHKSSTGVHLNAAVTSNCPECSQIGV